jgi:hypothetical protein
MHIKLTVSEFEEQFKPIANHIEPNAPWNGVMYETFGDELSHVRAIAQESPAKVWTVLDSDGEESLVSGYHHVNRMGYIVTEIPAIPGYSYDVADESAPDDDEELAEDATPG